MSRISISAAVRRRVAERDRRRCSYCQTQADVIGQPLEIDHVVSQALGGTSEESNLCLACSECNAHKGAQTHGTDPETGQSEPLFNPGADSWIDHFRWSNDGVEILGLTAMGRATIATLQMNRPLLIKARRRWVALGWHPPRE